MKTVLVTMGESGYINFIGQEKRYLELRKETNEFNKSNEQKIHLNNFVDELYYIGEDCFEDDVSDVVYRILTVYNKRLPIDAKVKSEIFKGIKIKHYL